MTDEVSFYDAIGLDDGGFHRRIDWGIYKLACQVSEDDFVVKIGYTKTPFDRLSAMVTALPFDFVMVWCSIGNRRTAQAAERWLHNRLKPFHQNREWFRFTADGKSILNGAFRQAVVSHAKKDRVGYVIDGDTLKQYKRIVAENKSRKNRAAKKKSIEQARLRMKEIGEKQAADKSKHHHEDSVYDENRQQFHFHDKGTSGN